MKRVPCTLLLVLLLVRTTAGQSLPRSADRDRLFAGLESYAASAGRFLSAADSGRALERVLASRSDRGSAELLDDLIALARPKGILSLRLNDQRDEDAFSVADLALLQRWRDAWLTCSRDALADNRRYDYDHVLARHHPAGRALALTLAALRNTAPEVDPERAERLKWRRDVAQRLWSDQSPADSAKEIAALQQKIRASLWEVGGNLHRVLETSPNVQRASQCDANWLLGSLPSRTALIDLQRYTPLSDRPAAAHYCAFVVAASQTRGRAPRFDGGSLQPAWQPDGEFLVERIELGPAAPLDAAAEAWVRAIRTGAPDRPLGHELARRLWEPLAARLPADLETIFLCAGGPLGQLPWSALPLPGEDDVLLDRYRLANVPFPHYLALWLTLTPDDLTWGHFSGAEDRFDLLGVADAALPTAPQELAHLQRLVPQLRTLFLLAEDATPERVMTELPRATVAHFALHGSFSGAALHAARRRGPLAESAVNDFDGLHYSALHLRPAAGRPRQEGMLTASMLTELHLTHLQLAVLAACQTGQGIAPLGEGTLSFVQALHGAGCANVVGTLWSVDDQQTTLLMAEFYERLWRQGMMPLDALRGAQLQLYRRPSAAAASLKRIPVGEGELLEADEAETAAPRAEGERTAPRHWAAFFLSGAGGLRAPQGTGGS